MTRLAAIANVGGCLLPRTNYDLDGRVSCRSRRERRRIVRIRVGPNGTTELRCSAGRNDVATGLQAVQSIVTAIVSSPVARLENVLNRLSFCISDSPGANGCVDHRFAGAVGYRAGND